MYRQKGKKKRGVKDGEGDGGAQEDLYGPLSRNWPSIYGTCHSRDAEVPSQLFMARHPITAHHSLNGTQPFGAAADPSLPFFFQIEAVSAAEHAGGGPLLITAAAADGRTRVKQSNLLRGDPRRGWRRRSTHTRTPTHPPTDPPTERAGHF